ncbi:MAG: hypothetical protein NVS3B14_12210 [Ktedonobacteraceae bacterium]
MTVHFPNRHDYALQHACRDAFTLAQHAQQQMLCADIVVLKVLRLFVCETQHFSGSLGKPVKPVSLVYVPVAPVP